MNCFVIFAMLALQIFTVFVENHNVEATIIRQIQANKSKFISTGRKKFDSEKSKQILQHNHDNNSTWEERNSPLSRTMKHFKGRHFRTSISSFKHKNNSSRRHFLIKDAAISNSSKHDNRPKPFTSLKMKNNHLNYNKLRNNMTDLGMKLKGKRQRKVYYFKSEKDHIGKASNVVLDQKNSLNNRSRLGSKTNSGTSIHHARKNGSLKKFTPIAAKSISNISNKLVTNSSMFSYIPTHEYSVNFSTLTSHSENIFKNRSKDEAFISTSSEKDLTQTLQLETDGTILKEDEIQNYTSLEEPMTLTYQIEIDATTLTRNQVKRSTSPKTDTAQTIPPVYKQNPVQRNRTDKIIATKAQNNKTQDKLDYLKQLRARFTSKSNNLETANVAAIKNDILGIIKSIQSTSANNIIASKDVNQTGFNFRNEKFKKSSSTEGNRRDITIGKETDSGPLKSSAVYVITETKDADNNKHYINIEYDTLNGTKAEIEQKLINIFDTNIPSKNFTFLYINTTKTRLKIMLPVSENGSVSLRDIEQLIETRISENFKGQVENYLLQISICQQISQFFLQHIFLLYLFVTIILIVFILILACCLSKYKEILIKKRNVEPHPCTSESNSISSSSSSFEEDQMEQPKDDVEPLISHTSLEVINERVERRKSKKEEERDKNFLKESKIDVDAKIKVPAATQTMKDKATSSSITECYLKRKSQESKIDVDANLRENIAKQTVKDKETPSSTTECYLKRKSLESKINVDANIREPVAKQTVKDEETPSDTTECDLKRKSLESKINVDANIRESVAKKTVKDKESFLDITEYDLKRKSPENERPQKKIKIFKDETVSRNDDEIQKISEENKKDKFPEPNKDDYHETKITSEAEVKNEETEKNESEQSDTISSESVAGKENEKRGEKSMFKSSKKNMQMSSDESDIQDKQAAGPARRFGRWMQRLFKPSKSKPKDEEMAKNNDRLQPSTSVSSRSPSEVNKKLSDKTVQDKRSEEKIDIEPLPKAIISESGLPLRYKFPPSKINALKRKSLPIDHYYKKIDYKPMQSDWDKLFLSSGNRLRSGKQKENLQPPQRYSKIRSLDSLQDITEKSNTEDETEAGSSPETSEYD